MKELYLFVRRVSESLSDLQPCDYNKSIRNHLSEIQNSGIRLDSDQCLYTLFRLENKPLRLAKKLTDIAKPQISTFQPYLYPLILHFYSL